MDEDEEFGGAMDSFDENAFDIGGAAGAGDDDRGSVGHAGHRLV